MFFLAIAGLLQAGVPDSLSLAAAERLALAHRAIPAVLAARVAEAEAARRVAGTVPNPTLSYSRTESAPRQHLTLDQPLDWMLRRPLDRRAASAVLGGVRADSAQAARDLTRDVRIAFYRARAAGAVADLVREQTGLADSLAQLAEARLRVGDISQFERDQARQEAARTRRTLDLALEQAAVERAGLARAIGWSAAVLPVPVGALDTLLGAPVLETVDPGSLPVVIRAQADSAAAAARAQSAARNRLPLPSLQIGAEWDDPTTTRTRALSLIGIVVPLPLWHHGSAALAEARARATEAAATVLETRLEAARQLQEAAIRLQGSATRARFARDSLLPSARSLRARALQAYRAGETGIFPVLDALRGERETTLGVLNDMLAYQESRAAWIALAEGWGSWRD